MSDHGWQVMALADAKAAYPLESCGLLVLIKGRIRYFKGRNMANDPANNFEINPADWAMAEDAGEVTGIVHSHPKTAPDASLPDMVAAEKLGLRFWIVNPVSEIWRFYEPKGYAKSLTGRPWVWAFSDCWTLVRDYYKEQGINLRDWGRVADPEEFMKNPTFDACWQETGFIELSGSEELKAGDSLLMSLYSEKLNHMAVYLGEGMILHHLQGRLSCREAYSEYYQLNTGRRLRHRALA